ncbi:MAG: transketolase [Ruminococcaceae bacterium]|nr:transketolase [Oscillospiraceae bacterium]
MVQEDTRAFAQTLRIELLRGLRDVGQGHLGGAMSVMDLLAVLYGGEMKIDPQNPGWDGRDYFVLSKGHAGPALYTALAVKGYFPLDWLKTINSNGTRLPSHCDRTKTPGVDMSAGSLGQGFSAAVGIAHGLKVQGKDNYVYTVVGDGECNEGQVWEAALYAPSHRLNHLIAFVDKNGKQLDGPTDDVLVLGDLRQKFEDFGWFALDVDGHDTDAIRAAIARGKQQTDKPTMIILHTVKGKGCSFVEHELNNHHARFTAAQADEAIAALEKGGC